MNAFCRWTVVHSEREQCELNPPESDSTNWPTMYPSASEPVHSVMMAQGKHLHLQEEQLEPLEALTRNEYAWVTLSAQLNYIIDRLQIWDQPSASWVSGGCSWVTCFHRQLGFSPPLHWRTISRTVPSFLGVNYILSLIRQPFRQTVPRLHF